MTNTPEKNSDHYAKVRSEIRHSLQAMCRMRVVDEDHQTVLFEDCHALLVDISQSGIRLELIGQDARSFMQQRFNSEARVMIDMLVPAHTEASLLCMLRWVKSTNFGCAIGLQSCASHIAIHRRYFQKLHPDKMGWRELSTAASIVLFIMAASWGAYQNNNSHLLQNRVAELQSYLRDSQAIVENLRRNVEISETKVAQLNSEMITCREDQQHIQSNTVYIGKASPQKASPPKQNVPLHKETDSRTLNAEETSDADTKKAQ
jgi:cell division protein FtsB